MEVEVPINLGSEIMVPPTPPMLEHSTQVMSMYIYFTFI